MGKGYEGAENSGPQSRDVHLDQPEGGGKGWPKNKETVAVIYRQAISPLLPAVHGDIMPIFGVPSAVDSGTLRMGPNITNPN